MWIRLNTNNRSKLRIFTNSLISILRLNEFKNIKYKDKEVKLLIKNIDYFRKSSSIIDITSKYSATCKLDSMIKKYY